MFRALRSRNYRLFFGGQVFSLIGTWMSLVATTWLVYRLTHSALWLGLVGFSGQILTFVLSPFTGVLADRWDRRRILIATQTLGMVQSFALAGLALSGTITAWQVLVLGSVQGLINAFDIPARQSFVVDMVEKKEDLGNAIALNSLLFNSARLIGPSIAGVIIAVSGEGACFLVDGFSYLGVIFALRAMQVTVRVRPEGRKHVLHELAEGVRYAFGRSSIRGLLILVAFMSLVGMPFSVLLPVYAKDILGGNSDTYGWLLAASGMGALCGSAYLATRKNAAGLGRDIVRSIALFGAGLVLFAFSRVLWFSMVLMALVGFGMIVQMAASNTLIQTRVEDDKRGRVMSFFAMAFMGMMSVGSLLAGSAAHRIGAPLTLFACGAACLAGALCVFGIQWSKRGGVMKRSLGIVLVCVAMCGTAWAQGFSADMVSRGQGREMRGKINVSDEKMRLEMQGSILITRMDQGVSWMLVPDQKTAMKQAIDPNAASQVSEKIKGEISREDLGDEAVGGRPARKFRATYEAEGQRMTVLQWIGKEGIPLKVASEDGKWSMEYQNLKVGAQPADLFEIPKDYQVLDFEAMKKNALSQMDALTRQSNN